MTVSYTTYVPGTPLQRQLEPLSKPKPVVVSLAGIPFKIGTAHFKPLKVNEVFLDVSLKVQTDSRISEEGVVLYDKYTFSFKSIDGVNHINLKEIPTEDVEQVISEIFETGAYKTKS